LISTVVMFQAQNREAITSTWKVAVSFKIIMTTSDERAQRDKTVFLNITPDLQYQDQDRFFCSQTGLVLRPMVSDHITGIITGIKTTVYN